MIIGDVPSWRVDHMPYGGVKDSGLGREGIRFAIEDMTEIRLLVTQSDPPGRSNRRETARWHPRRAKESVDRASTR